MELLFILIVYIFQVFCKHVLPSCLGKNKSYKIRKEQQKNRKGRPTSFRKTKIKPKQIEPSSDCVTVGLNLPFSSSRQQNFSFPFYRQDNLYGSHANSHRFVCSLISYLQAAKLNLEVFKSVIKSNTIEITFLFSGSLINIKFYSRSPRQKASQRWLAYHLLGFQDKFIRLMGSELFQKLIASFTTRRP